MFDVPLKLLHILMGSLPKEEIKFSKKKGDNIPMETMIPYILRMAVGVQKLLENNHEVTANSDDQKYPAEQRVTQALLM